MASKRPIKQIKRSSDVKRYVSEEEKDAERKYAKTTGILKYSTLALVILTLIFTILPVLTVTVDFSATDNGSMAESMLKDYDKSMSVTGFGLLYAFTETASFDNKEYGFANGKPYSDGIHYIIGEVPALQQVLNLGYGNLVFDEIKDGQAELLNTAYFMMMAVQILLLLTVIALAVFCALAIAKKFTKADKALRILNYIYAALTFVLFAFVLAITSNTTSVMTFAIGIGMWMNLLAVVCVTTIAVMNGVYRAKLDSFSLKQ